MTKGRLRKAVLWITVFFLAVLAALSVYSAFLGSSKATVFFNSPPLAVFWILLALLFAAGFFTVKSLVKRPALFLCHLGCLLVILGALWGSQDAHQLRARHFGSTKVREGMMKIHEGHRENRLYSADGTSTVVGELPFELGLDDFWIEYYESKGQLYSVDSNDVATAVTAEPGKVLDLGEGKPKIQITRAFKNFKIMIDGDRRIAHDAGGSNVNPALEVEITLPDGSKSGGHYVFARGFGGHGFEYEGLFLGYRYSGPSQISDYKSALAVVEDGEVVLRKTIEVNDPLHYGGYDFYQTGYDQQRGHYTVLSVTSDSGLVPVFIGYFFLCLGVIWQCWLRHLRPGKAVSA